MKNKIAVVALASTFLMGSFVTAFALPITEITPANRAFSGSSPTGEGSSAAVLPANTFAIGDTDYFGFNIPILGSYSIAAYVGAVFTDAVKISSFKLFDSTSLGTPGAEFSNVTYQTVISGKYLSIDPVTLAAGEYFLGVVASGTNATGTSGYSGVLSVSAVPLPASAPLFGAALLGLAGFGYAAKRKKVAASAA